MATSFQVKLCPFFTGRSIFIPICTDFPAGSSLPHTVQPPSPSTLELVPRSDHP
jgi:hypothetical protein